MGGPTRSPERQEPPPDAGRNYPQSEIAIEHPPGSFLTFWSPIYKLDRQQASAFATGPLRGVKLTIGTETYQIEPNAERGAKFQQNMAALPGAAPSVAPAK